MSASLTLTPESMSKFKANLKAIQRHKNVETPKLLRNAGRDLCWGAVRATPLGDTVKRSKVKGTNKYWVSVRHKYTGEKVVFPGRLKQVRLYGGKIRNRGFAKSGWFAALQLLGARVRKPAKSTRFASLRITRTGLTVSNAVPFIEDFDNGKNKKKAPLHILQRAMDRANAKMEKNLERWGKRVVR